MAVDQRWSSADVTLWFAAGQTGAGQSLWTEEMADWGGGLQDWTALLPLLVSPLLYQVLVQTILNTLYVPPDSVLVHIVSTSIKAVTSRTHSSVNVFNVSQTFDVFDCSENKFRFPNGWRGRSTEDVRGDASMTFQSPLDSLRTSETSYLNEAFSFYSAIRQRSYYYQVNKEDRYTANNMSVFFSALWWLKSWIYASLCLHHII